MAQPNFWMPREERCHVHHPTGLCPWMQGCPCRCWFFHNSPNTFALFPKLCNAATIYLVFQARRLLFILVVFFHPPQASLQLLFLSSLICSHFSWKNCLYLLLIIDIASPHNWASESLFHMLLWPLDLVSSTFPSTASYLVVFGNMANYHNIYPLIICK